MKLAAILLIVALAAGCTGQATEGNTVEITASGFSPKVLKIKAGETVAFLNKDTKTHWPASAAHPTHEGYPEGGGCIGSAFDACGPLKAGESYSFTFNHRGEWGYHDHLNSGMTGIIVVE